MSPLPWFETILLFSIVFPPLPAESFGGFEGGWLPVYFLSFYLETLLGIYFFISSTFPT